MLKVLILFTVQKMLYYQIIYGKTAEFPITILIYGWFYELWF